MNKKVILRFLSGVDRITILQQSLWLSQEI